MTTFTVDHDSLTVIATDEAGEHHDLNATGEPCATLDELRDFIGELCEQGFFDANSRNELLDAI